MVLETPTSCFDAEESWESDTIVVNAISLDKLKAGQDGIIVKVRTNNTSLTRLCHLGLTPGVHVRKIDSAPFGGPVKIRVRDTLLALGHGLAQNILISVDTAPAPAKVFVAVDGTPDEVQHADL